MDKDDKKLTEIRKLLDGAEEKINAAKRILFEQVYQEQAESLNLNDTGKATIIEGVFDGEEMIDKYGKKYPVPVNYSSKSKLVCGDNLKLTIAPDGTFIFKQIGPVERKRIIGKLTQNDENWIATCDGKKYNVLQASVSYFKAKPDDKITVILPKTGESNWAAIENIIEKDH
ncbi:TPA: hypothetical protein DD449_00235 [Candidatus Berkelbacteria bacterium]|uniref:50S ribosomal protein L7/L12 n=1 Tax=Berkelbacteria bacterium GW2011_GWE1_39_12 TaxID=1618337 RepID=A0A0G4B1Z4_9BACT|nr:MAG: hypothetical protein UT28_C0001G0035 [Berkelbacteria bacterium GW2011_GWE1_39_12]HBO60101.1 hypothetical protein [Candidatus Berkelbacteria bacterium]